MVYCFKCGKSMASYVEHDCVDYSKWETKEGNSIDIFEMTTEHIKNCIKMIKRSKYLDVMERYDTVPEPRPRYVDYDEYSPYLNIFKKELENRNARL